MKNVEARVQAEVVAWIRSNVHGCIVFAVPNGELITKSEAAKRKWTGVLAGVPDLAIVARGRVFFIECKRPGGKLSDEQRALIPQLHDLGAPCAVIQSLDQAKAAVSGWGLQVEDSCA